MTKELDDARTELHSAARRLANTATLPQNKGDQVEWVHNGCVWTRVGDDKWTGPGSDTFPSSHVALFEYKHLSRPIPEPAQPTEQPQELSSSTEVTPLMVATFKAAWAAADSIGAEGRRVEAGLRAVLYLLQEQARSSEPKPQTRRRVTVPAVDVIVGDILDYTLDSAEVVEVRRGQEQVELRLSDRPGWSIYPWKADVKVQRVVF